MSHPSAMEPTSNRSKSAAWLGLFMGPLLALALFFWLPREYNDSKGNSVDFSAEGRATLAMMAWMGTWWLTEAVPIYATALLPLAVFPVFGVADMKSTSAAYGNPLIFLFMGGFLLALSMQKWGLGKRIALRILTIVGTRPVNMIAGFMFTTAVLSAFVSNTATTAMMLPIAASVIRLVQTQHDRHRKVADKKSKESSSPRDNFAICIMLGIAYSASIGGTATIIGTPPNVFLVSFLSDSIAEPYRTDVSFAKWLLIGIPLSIVFLPVVLWLLTRLYPIPTQSVRGGHQLIRDELASLGPIHRGEWATFFVFVTTALLWILRPVLVKVTLGDGAATWSPFIGLTDAGIVMIAAMALFVIPVDMKQRQFVLDWETALKLPWGVLILFGGGLSLAAAVKTNQVADFLGSYAGLFAGLPPVIVILIVSGGMIFLTELTSNTATSATLLPVLGAIAPALGLHPYLLVVPAAIAASCAFMLPVATPPNAIVFGLGMVNIREMIKAGFWLNLIAIVLVTLLTMLLVRPLMIP